MNGFPRPFAEVRNADFSILFQVRNPLFALVFRLMNGRTNPLSHPMNASKALPGLKTACFWPKNMYFGLFGPFWARFIKVRNGRLRPVARVMNPVFRLGFEVRNPVADAVSVLMI